MKMNTITLALAAFAMLSLSARADDKANILIGKWEVTKEEVPTGSTAEFSKDGKFKVILKGAKTMTNEGTYKLDGDTLRVTSTDPRGKEQTKFYKIKKLTDKELVIEEQGKEIAFKKVK